MPNSIRSGAQLGGTTWEHNGALKIAVDTDPGGCGSLYSARSILRNPNAKTTTPKTNINKICFVLTDRLTLGTGDPGWSTSRSLVRPK